MGNFLPWVLIGVILIASRLLLAGANLLHRRRSPHAELSRKLLHVGMGLLLLPLPWMFDRAWPVLVLMGIYVAAMVGGMLFASLGSHIGTIHGVQRRTLGHIFFPIIVAGLFVAARGNRLLYCIPLLVMTLADTAAALVGTRYGRRKIPGTAKTVEGSMAFAAVAMLIVLIALFALPPGAPPLGKALGLAVSVGLLCALLEAICSHGLDNLVVPMAAFALVKALGF